MRVFVILVCATTSLFAQQKFELREYTGKVIAVQPFWEFALERMVVEIDGTIHYYNFSPEYGKLFTERIKPGQIVSLKVNVHLYDGSLRDKIPSSVRDYFFRDHIVAINLDGVWTETPRIINENTKRVKMVLDKKINDIYQLTNLQRGLIFQDGLVAYRNYPDPAQSDMSGLKKGDMVSFIGYAMDVKEGFVFPVKNVKEVVFFRRLYRENGEIKSLLFKQNSVCIGVVILVNGREVKVSFPSNYAKRIQTMADARLPVTVYFDDFKMEGNLQPPELHAIIQGADSVKILEYGFYGGADIFHQHKSTSVTGKITSVNRLSSGAIGSIVVNKEAYVELDFATQKQLKHLLKKGVSITINGKERIKAEGEVYNQNYRLITPEQVVLENKTFVLN